VRILVLNCGSSTVKFQLIETDQALIAADADRRVAKGLIERIGGQALINFTITDGARERLAGPIRDHRAAIDRILHWLVARGADDDRRDSVPAVEAVGHRVVHGGERFRGHVAIDETVVKGIEDCIELAPLHNPVNLKGIRAARELLGRRVPQVAVFDTAFHAGMPESAYLYGIPYRLFRRHKIPRYGFPGTPPQYLVYRYGQMRGCPPEQVNVITLHLGNGCSACAVRAGRSINTSMGFTPLEGLLMGTRSGDIDPSLVEYLVLKEGLSVSEVDTLLNKHSGLLGVSGLTSDMRELLEEEAEHHDRRARLAIDENSAEIRARICQGLECLGLELDAPRNRAATGGRGGPISAANSRLAAYVIPTDEELLIARETYRALSG